MNHFPKDLVDSKKFDPGDLPKVKICYLKAVIGTQHVPECESLNNKHPNLREVFYRYANERDLSKLDGHFHNSRMIQEESEAGQAITLRELAKNFYHNLAAHDHASVNQSQLSEGNGIAQVETIVERELFIDSSGGLMPNVYCEAIGYGLNNFRYLYDIVSKKWKYAPEMRVPMGHEKSFGVNLMIQSSTIESKNFPVNPIESVFKVKYKIDHEYVRDYIQKYIAEHSIHTSSLSQIDKVVLEGELIRTINFSGGALGGGDSGGGLVCAHFENKCFQKCVNKVKNNNTNISLANQDKVLRDCLFEARVGEESNSIFSTETNETQSRTESCLLKRRKLVGINTGGANYYGDYWKLLPSSMVRIYREKMTCSNSDSSLCQMNACLSLLKNSNHYFKSVGFIGSLIHGIPGADQKNLEIWAGNSNPIGKAKELINRAYQKYNGEYKTNYVFQRDTFASRGVGSMIKDVLKTCSPHVSASSGVNNQSQNPIRGF